MPRKPTLPPNRPPLQFRDRVIEEWIETQREEGESAGLCAARLLHEYRALLADPVVAGETKRMRKIRALVDPAMFAAAKR